jgi:hypothetical protein
VVKPRPEHDFPFSVRHEVWEAAPDSRHLYEGIYSVALNHGHGATVTFVARIDRPTSAVVTLPTDFDAISTSTEARLIALAVARYAVTADDRRAGSDELATWIDWGGEESHRVPVVFYVTEDEFRVYQEELAGLSEMFSGIHDAVPVSAVADREVVGFLLRRVLRSNRFSPKDREQLGR